MGNTNIIIRDAHGRKHKFDSRVYYAVASEDHVVVRNKTNQLFKAKFRNYVSIVTPE